VKSARVFILPGKPPTPGLLPGNPNTRPCPAFRNTILLHQVLGSKEAARPIPENGAPEPRTNSWSGGRRKTRAGCLRAIGQRTKRAWRRSGTSGTPALRRHGSRGAAGIRPA